MAKIYRFVPKNDVTKKEYLKPCKVVKIDDDYMPFINMSMMAYLEKRDYDSIYFFNKANSIFSKKYVRGLDFSLVGITHFYNGNYDLALKYLYNSMSEIEHIRTPLSLIIYQIYYMKKDYKAMDNFANFALKNGFITSKDDLTLISPLEGRPIEMVNPNSKINIEKIKNEIMHALDIKNFDKACRLLDMAVNLDETDPYIWYLRNNVDEAFNGKAPSGLPEFASLELINKIDKSLEDNLIFNDLISQNDSASLIRFALEYLDREKAFAFFTKLFSNPTTRMINLAIDQMFSVENDNKRLDLCFILFSHGLVQKISFRNGQKVNSISLGDMRVAKHISMEFVSGILNATRYLILNYDEINIDLMVEISKILKGVNAQNLSLLFDSDNVRDMILYSFCKRKQIEIFDMLKNQEDNLINKLAIFNVKFIASKEVNSENVIFINSKNR